MSSAKVSQNQPESAKKSRMYLPTSYIHTSLSWYTFAHNIRCQPLVVWCVSSIHDVWLPSIKRSEPPDELQQSRQRVWDRAAAAVVASRLLDISTADDIDRARLRAAAQSHSGAWLNALPVASFGRLQDGETLRIAVALRVGTRSSSMCAALLPLWGQRGHEGPARAVLPAKRRLAASARRSERHQMGPPQRRYAICTGANGTGSERRQTPWSSDNASVLGGKMSDLGQHRADDNHKLRRCAELDGRFKFQPIAVETRCPLGRSTLPFLKILDRSIARETGDKRETQFIFQRASLVVLRSNATSFLMGSSASMTPAPQTSAGEARSSEPVEILAPARHLALQSTYSGPRTYGERGSKMILYMN